MSGNNSERIRKAARDGYLEILRDATRKECNAPDEDGMTATHWAAFSGNLDALRIIVGRGGDPSKCDFFGNTALHWSAANGHFNCVSFLVSFGVNLWSLDNQYHSAKDVALNNSPESMQIIQFLDHVVAKQSALNTKMVQKMKEKALVEAEKRIKAFQKTQSKTTKQAEKEEKLREKHRKKNMCLLRSSQEGVYSDLNHNETHIYEMPSSGKAHLIQPHSTISSNSSTMKFSDLVNLSLKSSKSGTARMKILSGVSRKVLIRKQNSTDTMKSNEPVESGANQSIHSLVGIRRDDQIMYVPRYGSLSVTNLAANLDEIDSDAQNKYSSNSRLHMRDVFNLETNVPRSAESKTNTFNKNSKSSIKSRLLKFNNRHITQKNKPSGSLYRTISEPDFTFMDHDKELKTDNPPVESSSIFERPGFGSVAFRGKFTPESLFFMPRYYRADSAGNSDEDADSGHDHSHDSNASSITKKYLTSKNMSIANLATSLSPDRDSFASDSIGSAGSLVQTDCLDEHFDEMSPELQCLPLESKSIPVLLFLYAHGLKEYYDVFEAEKIDIDALMLLTENDLISLAIPLGPRRKLLNAIHQRRRLLDNNGQQVFETKL